MKLYESGRCIRTSDAGDVITAIGTGQLELPVGAGGDEVGRLEAIGCLGCPLLLLTEAPKDEDTGEDGCEREGEPGALRDFQQYGREIGAVERAKDEEAEKHQEGVQAPDEQRDERDHAGRDEGDHNDTDAVRVT